MISVIVCTYNRCESIRDTINSLLTQQCSSTFDYEIIIIDNNSTDNTKHIAMEYVQKNAHVKYAFETKQGVSYAKNRGLEEAKGEIIAFTDDDVIVDKKWLNNIFLSFKNNNADCVGGKILPIWHNTPPTWLSKKLYGKLALLDYGNESFEIKFGDMHNIFGANYAFKKHIFVKYGLFRTDLGRRGKRLFSGEDTAYIELLLKNQAKVIYEPSAIVYHKVNDKRLRKSYFRKWHFYTGISTALSDSEDRVIKTFFDVPRYLIRDFFSAVKGYCKFMTKKDWKEVFNFECKIIFYLSYFSTKIKHYLKLSKKKHASS